MTARQLRSTTRIATWAVLALACYAVPHRVIEIQRDGLTHQQPHNFIARNER
ncbi:hypothetical protein [Pseudoxanthomonas sp.]|uniref:hypothetical protein n=1 Tax=Pseudoxanthomonas sp. TaxID=1871049 RepID=UPI00261151C8|nr:hypothetical protein [Pseudoxanthomonas sp.]WDS36203.1 MAG: hypothetical protein O8I58_18360 [Pseudoxanthomonas sp.]